MGDPTTRWGGRFPPEVVRHPYGLNQHSDEDGAYSTLYDGFVGAGRISPHGTGSDSGPLLEMIIAYDLTREARCPDGRPVYDEEMHRRIVEDLIVAGCEDYEHWQSLHNKAVTARSLIVAVGLLLEQPDRFRRGLEGYRRIMSDRFHFDGFYAESPAYMVHNYWNMRQLPDLLCGYSDPPGYMPGDGPRLDDLNPYTDEHLRLALVSMARMLARGNRLPVIGDTTYDAVIDPLYAEVLAARLEGPYAGLLETLTGKKLPDWGSEYSLWYRSPDLRSQGQVALPLRTEWFPGWHVGVLRGGRPASSYDRPVPDASGAGPIAAQSARGMMAGCVQTGEASGTVSEQLACDEHGGTGASGTTQ